MPWHLEAREFPGQITPIHETTLWQGESNLGYLYPGETFLSYLQEQGRSVLDRRWSVPLYPNGRLPVWDVRVYGMAVRLPFFMAVGDLRAPTRYAAELLARMQVEALLCAEVAWNPDLTVVVMPDPNVNPDLTRDLLSCGDRMRSRVQKNLEVRRRQVRSSMWPLLKWILSGIVNGLLIALALYTAIVAIAHLR